MPFDSVSILEKQIMFWFWYWAPGGSAFIAMRSVLISPGICAQRLIQHWHISSPQTSETMVSQTGYSTLPNINHYPQRSRSWSTSTIPNYITPESQLSNLRGTHTWSIIQNVGRCGNSSKNLPRNISEYTHTFFCFLCATGRTAEANFFETTHLQTSLTF